MTDYTTLLSTPLADFKSAFEGTFIRHHVTLQNGNLYFRYDTEDNTAKENWDLFCWLQEELRRKGYEIKDPCIEHDCISGDLRQFKK